MKKQKTTFRWSEQQTTSQVVSGSSTIQLPNGVTVDASCNQTVTISCLKELYNAVGFSASAKNGNQIGITGYLGEFANNEDLQSFYADQRPDALNSSFKFVSVNGMFFFTYGRHPCTCSHSCIQVDKTRRTCRKLVQKQT